MNDVLMSISSNDQERVRLLGAVQALSKVGDICCLSHWYLNNPADPSVSKTPHYTNGVLLLATSFDISALTAFLKQTELLVGGRRQRYCCPLDIDIVAFHGLKQDVQQRTLPRCIQSEEAYIWYCIQDIYQQLKPNIPLPIIWRRQLWPEFAHWQAFNQHNAARIAQLLGCTASLFPASDDSMTLI